MQMGWKKLHVKRLRKEGKRNRERKYTKRLKDESTVESWRWNIFVLKCWREILSSKTGRRMRMTEDINKCLDSGVEIECGILRKKGANLASESSGIRDCIKSLGSNVNICYWRTSERHNKWGKMKGLGVLWNSTPAEEQTVGMLVFCDFFLSLSHSRLWKVDNNVSQWENFAGWIHFRIKRKILGCGEKVIYLFF